MNWISLELVADEQYPIKTLDPSHTHIVSGSGVASETVSVTWNELEKYKACESTFDIAKEGCLFQVLLGSEFMKNGADTRSKPEANILSRGAKERFNRPCPIGASENSKYQPARDASEHFSQPSALVFNASPQEEEEEA